jgi:hypothetical protein
MVHGLIVTPFHDYGSELMEQRMYDSCSVVESQRMYSCSVVVVITNQ